jgi:hypothetical protein
LAGTEQIAGGQVNQQPFVVEIDGDVTLLDLRRKRPDQSTLSFIQFSHLGREFVAQTDEFLVSIGELFWCRRRA